MKQKSLRKLMHFLRIGFLLFWLVLLLSAAVFAANLLINRHAG